MTYRRLRYSKAETFRPVVSGVAMLQIGNPASFLDEILGTRAKTWLHWEMLRRAQRAERREAGTALGFDDDQGDA